MPRRQRAVPAPRLGAAALGFPTTPAGPGRHGGRAGGPVGGHGPGGAELQPRRAEEEGEGARARDERDLRGVPAPELLRLLLVGAGHAGRHGERRLLLRVCGHAVDVLQQADQGRGGVSGGLLWGGLRGLSEAGWHEDPVYTVDLTMGWPGVV